MVGCLDHSWETLDLSDDKLCLRNLEAVNKFSHGVCRIASICTSASCNDTQEKDWPVDLLISHATLAPPSNCHMVIEASTLTLFVELIHTQSPSCKPSACHPLVRCRTSLRALRMEMK